MKWINILAAKGMAAVLVLAATAGAGAYVKTHYDVGGFAAAVSHTFRAGFSSDSLSEEKPAFEMRLSAPPGAGAQKESSRESEETASAPAAGRPSAVAPLVASKSNLPNLPSSSASPSASPVAPSVPGLTPPNLPSPTPAYPAGRSHLPPPISVPDSPPPLIPAEPSSSPSVVTPPVSSPPPVLAEPPSAATGIMLNEVMAGTEAGSDEEFIELYNPSSEAVSLTGWSVKKKSSTGSETSFVVASRLEGKSVPAGGYFLLKNEGSDMSTPPADVSWPHSYTLAYTNNALTLYDGSGAKVSEMSWTEIPKGKSFGLAADGSFAVLPAPSPKAHN